MPEDFCYEKFTRSSKKDKFCDFLDIESRVHRGKQTTDAEKHKIKCLHVQPRLPALSLCYGH